MHGRDTAKPNDQQCHTHLAQLICSDLRCVNNVYTSTCACVCLRAYFFDTWVARKGEGQAADIGEMACLKATALVQWLVVRSSQQPAASGFLFCYYRY